jgi:ribonuclease HI
MHPLPDGEVWYKSTQHEHINTLELRAVFLALQRLDIRRFCIVDIFVDNTSALSWMRGKMPKKYVVCLLRQRIARCLLEKDLLLGSATYVRSEDNPADGPSRRFEL